MKSFVALAVLAACGCTTLPVEGSRILSVREVVDRHHELDGQLVRVRGWLSLCGRMSCWLTPSADREREPHLSIGSSQQFDTETRNLIGRRIIIDARLDADCLHAAVDPPRADGTIIVCSDRADVLADPKLVQAL